MSNYRIQSPVVWTGCQHRSHRLRLPCWRRPIYDDLCAKHNGTCFHTCPPEPGGPQ